MYGNAYRFFYQAENCIRDGVASRGHGKVYNKHDIYEPALTQVRVQKRVKNT